MTTGNITTSLLLCLSLTFALPLWAADEDSRFKEHLDKANDYIKAYRHFEAGDELKKATKIGGAKHPSLHMRLGILYYGLGLIPEAIVEGEKAVALAPASKWYKYDLAKFYYVDKQYTKAEELFTALLKQDPGFTLGYYYLGELYFRNKDFDMAWLSLQRARLLGHQGNLLEEKLLPYSKKPREDFNRMSKNDMILRFIKLSSEEEANIVLEQLSKGKLFENLELEWKKETTEADFGVLNVNELKDSVADAMRSRQPYSPSVVMKTDTDYRIMQRIAPFDPAAWRATVNAWKKDANSERLTPQMAGKEEAPEAQQAPAGKGKEQLATQLSAYYALESWKNAWQAADVSKYLAAYSAQFIPQDNMDLATWKRKRTASLTRPKFIHVTIKDPVVELQTENRLLVTFTQLFQSDTYQDVTVKTLTMTKEQGGWKICEEKSTGDFSR